MKYRLLGRTGVFVSELCLGVMTFGGRGWWSELGSQNQDEADELVARAIDAGVTLFDTAEAYSDGDSEQILGRALGPRRKSVMIATKVGGRLPVRNNDFGLTRAHIINAVEASLSRLNTDYIDLYQTHTLDPLTPIDETLRALDDLVRAGKVRYLGCSNYYAWQIMKALGVSERQGLARFESLQAYYSIAGRDLERETIPLLNDQKLGLLVWSPLAGGFLTDKFAGGQGPETARRTKFDFPPLNKKRALECLAIMKEIAAAHDATVARIALAWLLHQPCVTSVVFGARDARQLEDNLKATEISLSAEELAQLDRVSALEPEYPGWLIRQIVARGEDLSSIGPLKINAD